MRAPRKRYIYRLARAGYIIRVRVYPFSPVQVRRICCVQAGSLSVSYMVPKLSGGSSSDRPGQTVHSK